jgi:outer membrane protein, multidrug efflux system
MKEGAMNASSTRKFSLYPNVRSVSSTLGLGLSRSQTIGRITYAVFPVFLFLSGCAVGPNYKRPNVPTPPVYRGPSDTAQQASLADLPWWEIFHDETLTELIKTALANNYNLEVAAARVEQARQVDALARSQYFPTLGYQTFSSYGHNQFIYSPIGPPNGAQGFLLAIARVSWEADLWGRIRRTNESARAQLLASEEARRGVMLTLVGDVSQAYFELLGLRLQLDIARESTQSFTTVSGMRCSLRVLQAT